MFHTFAGHRSSAGRRPGRHSRLGTNSDRGYRILEVTYLIGVSSGSFALSIFGKGLRNLLMNGEQDVNELNFQHSHLYNAKYSSVTVYVLKQTRIWKKHLIYILCNKQQPVTIFYHNIMPVYAKGVGRESRRNVTLTFRDHFEQVRYLLIYLK